MCLAASPGRPGPPVLQSLGYPGKVGTVLRSGGCPGYEGKQWDASCSIRGAPISAWPLCPPSLARADVLAAGRLDCTFPAGREVS